MATTVAQVKDWLAQGLAQRERLEELGEQLRVLAGDLAAAEYRWLVLLEEFDRGGGWGVQGARSCAEWLSWACGLSVEAARERLRVARALPGLPVVSEVFAAGRLSYSKVRAVTRVATAGNEAAWVEFALSGTASHVERLVRAQRRAELAEDPLAEQVAFEGRFLRWRDHDDGTTSVTLRGPSELVAEVVAAVEAVERRRFDERPEAARPQPEDGAEALRARAEAGAADAPVVSERWDLGPPVEARRFDALSELVAAGAVHGPVPGAVPEVVVVLGPEHLAEDEPGQDEPGQDEPGNDVSEQGAPAEASSPAPAPPAVLRRGRGETALGAGTARLLACDAHLVALVEDADGAPVGVSRRTRTIPRGVRRALDQRDKGCRFPGCVAIAFVDAHHVRHWSQGGPTVLWNLLLLCRFHHRLVHLAGYRVTAHGDQTFSFHRPDGGLLPPGMALPGGRPEAVAEANRARGVLIDADTVIPDWDGDPPDYDLALEVIHNATFPRKRGRDHDGTDDTATVPVYEGRLTASGEGGTT